MSYEILKAFDNGDILSDKELLTLRYSLKRYTDYLNKQQIAVNTSDFEEALLISGARHKLYFVESMLLARGIKLL